MNDYDKGLVEALNELVKAKKETVAAIKKMSEYGVDAMDVGDFIATENGIIEMARLIGAKTKKNPVYPDKTVIEMVFKGIEFKQYERMVKLPYQPRRTEA